jgi:hypothetical protein
LTAHQPATVATAALAVARACVLACMLAPQRAPASEPASEPASQPASEPAAGAAPAPALELQLTAGSPFTALDARYALNHTVALDLRLSLIETHALRPGAGTRIRWLDTLIAGTPLALTTELTLLRAFGFDAADTWDAELLQELTLQLDRNTGTTATLRAGVIGYLGEEPSHRGIIGLLALRTAVALAASWKLGLELGWMADRFTGRPLGAVLLSYDL